MSASIGLAELKRLVDEGAQWVEVLPAAHYPEEHLPGAIDIPLKQLDATTARQLALTRPGSCTAGTASETRALEPAKPTGYRARANCSPLVMRETVSSPSYTRIRRPIGSRAISLTANSSRSATAK